MPCACPAQPINDHEPVDSSAAAIAAQGLLRLGRYLQQQGQSQEGSRYWQAGLTVLRTLLGAPYLSTEPGHQGLLLHAIYHRPRGWDHVPLGSKIPHGESCMWGDYHLLEVGLYVQRIMRSETYHTFFGPTEPVAAAVTYKPRLHVVLYQPEIPQNAGNVARTCVAVGAKLWLVRPLGFALDSHHLQRAGLDYWPHLAWNVVDNWDALGQAVSLERAWFFSKAAPQPYTRAHFQEGDVLVFGSETQGLPSWLMAQHGDRTLRIPMRPQVRSLNLSNAVAVAVYEAARLWLEGECP